MRSTLSIMLILVSISACGRGAGRQPSDVDLKPAVRIEQDGQTYGAARDRLAQFSEAELEAILERRTNKTTYSPTADPAAGVSTAEVLDEIRFRQKTIYGADRRRDYYEIQNPEQIRVTGSVGAMVKPANFTIQGAELTLTTRSLGEAQNLCSGEPFADQPAAAYCTAFVVGNDLLATAAHCVVEGFKSTRIIFGYRVEVNEHGRKLVSKVPLAEVYSPTEVVSQKSESGEDYAIIRVDRPIKNHPPLALERRREGSRKDTLVYVAGYPAGLPLKLADDAVIRSETDHFFLTNADTFGGNSGSPVFDAVTHTVIGILDRGDVDFRTRGFCQVSVVCPENGCSGEACTWMAVVEGLESVQKSTANSLRNPIVRTYSSGPKLSGSGGAFSAEYIVKADPAPDGYEIGRVDYSLSGDRSCGNWSTCRVSTENGTVALHFSLQGHNEWPAPGQAQSEGHLVVTYVPSGTNR